MEGWLFGLGVGLGLFAALMVVSGAVRSVILPRDGPRFIQRRLIRILTGWRAMAAALLLSGAAGLAVWAGAPPTPEPATQIESASSRDAGEKRLDALVAAQERTAAAQERSADALDRLVGSGPAVQPPRHTWLTSILAPIFGAAGLGLLAGGVALLSRALMNGTLKEAGLVVTALLLSGSIFGGFAMIGELRLSPTLELSLLKWTDARSPEARGPTEPAPPQPPEARRLPADIEADCKAGFRIGPFEPGRWALPAGAIDRRRLTGQINGRDVRGYLLIGSTDPTPFRRDVFPADNAELAQARAEAAAQAIRDMGLQPAPLLMALNSSLPLARMTGRDESAPARREVLVCRLVASDA